MKASRRASQSGRYNPIRSTKKDRFDADSVKFWRGSARHQTGSTRCVGSGKPRRRRSMLAGAKVARSFRGEPWL